MDFPRVTAACREARALLDIKPVGSREERRLELRGTAAKRVARSAYADEMLPAILGSQWMVPSTNASWPNALLSTSERHTASLHALFDHPMVFRLRGTKGPLTWANAAIVGHPYDALAKDDTPTQGAIREAAYLAQYNIPVWIRRDLSSWYPGWTQLTLAAIGLKDLEAERFGFSLLPSAMRH